MEYDTPNPVAGIGERHSVPPASDILRSAEPVRPINGGLGLSHLIDTAFVVDIGLSRQVDDQPGDLDHADQRTGQAFSSLAAGSLQRVVVHTEPADLGADGGARLRRAVTEIARVLAWGGDLIVASGSTGDDRIVEAMAIVDITVPYGFVVVDLGLRPPNVADGRWSAPSADEAAGPPSRPVFHLRKAVR